MAGPYSPTMLDHVKRPRNRGALPSPTVSQEGANPLCGDRVRIELALDGDVVTAARFTANACAICIAASSMLTELIRGAPLEDVETLTVPELIAQLKAEIPASRMACVRLPLTVLHTGLLRHTRA
ncbi:MAG TPA: iron-sulfur cluster assembly scaffold protein, partial [Gemmatimonadaceae bacterium]|nr:iron-sulfur cluster assembly scaffold protein [Gemmatimonadaceae bacterium]